MDILVLDSIHGGRTLSQHLSSSGHRVDLVDVYRQETEVTMSDALQRRYDLIVAPVHLDPDSPLMHIRNTPYITHHEAVQTILGDRIPRPMVEITGTRGKTTTACALAHLLDGTGVVHTSSGTWRYPEHTLLWKRSITPASVIDAAYCAHSLGGWLIAEESLGVSGAGDIGVLTSGDDYPIAGGRKRALSEKKRLLARCRIAVIAPGVDYEEPNAVFAGDVASVRGTECRYSFDGISGVFSNPLLALDGYRIPLLTAATVAAVLSVDPAPLETFRALEGRMQVSWKDGICIVDNSNSGANAATAQDAAIYARTVTGMDDLTLVIGAEAKNVCEGFPREDILSAIAAISPRQVVLVGPDCSGLEKLLNENMNIATADDLDQGMREALAMTKEGSIILAVKTWR